jgi:hypothetical protein
VKASTIIPSRKKLIQVYNLLQASKQKLTEKDIIEWAGYSRFDPRLAEILISYLTLSWRTFNPLKMRELNLSEAWPQTLAVLLEHVELNLKNTKKDSDVQLFKLFKDLLLFDIQPAEYQSYTIGLFSVGGQLQKKCSELPHPIFKKWGFYENDLFLSKTSKGREQTLYDVETRKRVLKSLLKTNKKISVNDYIEACRFSIHRRQAERDLSQFFKLKKTGRTRGRLYSR